MKKSRKKILFICLIFMIIIGASVLINATTVIENEIRIEFKDENLYNAVRNYFADRDNNIKHNTNDETLTIRSITRRRKLNNRVKF